MSEKYFLIHKEEDNETYIDEYTTKKRLLSYLNDKAYGDINILTEPFDEAVGGGNQVIIIKGEVIKSIKKTVIYE